MFEQPLLEHMQVKQSVKKLIKQLYEQCLSEYSHEISRLGDLV